MKIFFSIVYMLNHAIKYTKGISGHGVRSTPLRSRKRYDDIDHETVKLKTYNMPKKIDQFLFDYDFGFYRLN